MNFKDIGIIIAKKFLKEKSSIITVFTENHGLYSGVIQESSKKSGSIYQEGNIVDFLWQARLHEHLGTAKCELIKSYSSYLITNKTNLYAFNSIISLIKLTFHERENHNNFFPFFTNFLESLKKEFNFKNYIKFELAILKETGYGIDIDQCVVSGSKNNLIYVSPKSGMAICESAGSLYKDRLLILPQFLTTNISEITNIDRKHAFDLTTYFFSRYFFNNLKQPYSREIFIEHIMLSSLFHASPKK